MTKPAQPEALSAPAPDFAALIGLDWADQNHALCLYDCATGQTEHSTLIHTPEAIAAWAETLRERCGGRPVALCLEQAKGPLLSALCAHEFLTLYPVNPATAARYRQAFKTSRAKSDPTDAQVCLDLLRHHRAQLTPLLQDDAPTRHLARLLEARRGAVDLRTLLTNMLRDALKASFPQALELSGQDLFAPLACQFLLKWPTLQELQRARPQTVRQFYYLHRCRRPALVQERLDAIAQMTPLSTDPALLEPAKIQVQMLARQLLHLGQAIKQYDSQVEERFALHRDASLWQSFPGAGPILGPRLACAFGSERSRYPAAAALQQYSGIAPVTEKSGKPTSSTRPSLNTPANPPSTALGPSSTSPPKSPAAKLTPAPSAPSPLSGSASCSSAGAIASPTTKPNISPPYTNAAPSSPPNSTLSAKKPPNLAGQ